VIEPAAKGWRFILRGPGTRAVDRFFTNLEFPIRFVGNLLQAEGYQATEEFGRFLVNTTVGIAGFFDPATPLGLGIYEEDVGQAFGRYGVGPGAYLVVPLLGPSNVRDFIGGTADSALLGPASIARTTLGNLNTRALYIEDIAEAKKASLDYYAFVRNAYLTNRLALVENRDPEASKPGIDPSIYDVEEDEAEPKEEQKP
jgi:phospholipid-binding lipoprotein MlaA